MTGFEGYATVDLRELHGDMVEAGDFGVRFTLVELELLERDGITGESGKKRIEILRAEGWNV